jgi:hypothetical protein
VRWEGGTQRTLLARSLGKSRGDAPPDGVGRRVGIDPGDHAHSLVVSEDGNLHVRTVVSSF